MKIGITNTLLALLLSSITSLASAAESTPEGTNATPGHEDLSYAMQKSMDPNVWMKLKTCPTRCKSRWIQMSG